jgi:MFS superfamily sulfate permease-like transporter
MKSNNPLTELWDMESQGKRQRKITFRSFAERIGKDMTPWRILKFVLGASSIALALGWSRYVGVHDVYLPAFPDYLDVALGVGIGLFLFSDYFKEIFKE